VLKQRAPALAADLDRIEEGLGAADVSEEGLAAAAADLHRLAYPR
jgi:hypothetical protein